jgi:hypothetical protein
VGLSVFPPARRVNDRCATPTNSQQRYGYDTFHPWYVPSSLVPGMYSVGSLVNDYLVQSSNGWILNGSSSLIGFIGTSLANPGCIRGAGTTSYSNAIEEAQHELEVRGRGDVQDVIVFLSDGAANTTPRFLPSYLDTPTVRPYMQLHPCAAGMAVADNVKGKGTIIYTIGYDLNGMGTDPENCKLYPSGSNDSTITAQDAIEAMATDPDGAGPEEPNFYNKPDPGKLNIIFTRIAADLARPAARLIDDDTQ